MTDALKHLLNAMMAKVSRTRFNAPLSRPLSRPRQWPTPHAPAGVPAARRQARPGRWRQGLALLRPCVRAPLARRTPGTASRCRT